MVAALSSHASAPWRLAMCERLLEQPLGGRRFSLLHPSKRRDPQQLGRTPMGLRKCVALHRSGGVAEDGRQDLHVEAAQGRRVGIDEIRTASWASTLSRCNAHS